MYKSPHVPSQRSKLRSYRHVMIPLSCYDYNSVLPLSSSSLRSHIRPRSRLRPLLTALRPIAPAHSRSRTAVTVRAPIARVVFHFDSLLLCLHFVLSLYWFLSSRFSRSCRDCLRQLPPFRFVFGV